MASNPVFNRIDKESRQGYAGFGSAPQQSATAGMASNGAMSQRQLEDLYRQPSAGPVQTGRVTLDDVVMKTLGLFAVVLAFGAAAWVLQPSYGLQLWGLGLVGILGLGFAIALKKTVSVPLILAYAAFEGLFVGAISHSYSNAFDQPGTTVFGGIVTQAVLGTLCVFAAMLFAYRTRIIRVTEKFRRIMTMALLGYFLFALVNLGYALIAHQPFGLGGSSFAGFAISLFAIGLAAFTLALDFDSIERAIDAGAPQKYSWLLAHGLVVTLVWLYLEILRLLGRMRSN